MSAANNSEAFYQKLKTQLYDTALWPSEYLFKFIVHSNTSGVEDIKSLFQNEKARIITNTSKNGTYTSVSITVTMKNPEAVILKYKEVSENVEGVISL